MLEGLPICNRISSSSFGGASWDVIFVYLERNRLWLPCCHDVVIWLSFLTECLAKCFKNCDSSHILLGKLLQQTRLTKGVWTSPLVGWPILIVVIPKQPSWIFSTKYAIKESGFIERRTEITKTHLNPSRTYAQDHSVISLSEDAHALYHQPTLGGPGFLMLSDLNWPSLCVVCCVQMWWRTGSFLRHWLEVTFSNLLPYRHHSFTK